MKQYIYCLIILGLVACGSIQKNDKPMESKLFKILTPIEWQHFQQEKIFKGSELDSQDNFIHLSFSHQWNKTWQKFFNSKEAYLVEFDMKSLEPGLLKIEANRPGGEEYPHYYGNLSFASVVSFKQLGKE